ncbi:MAG: phage regulatory protein/antirepressor Ant [Rhodocyclaceae bacterium]
MNLTTTIHGGSTDGPTMTSRELADLTGKQHQHVKRDIRNMLEALGKGVSSFGRTYKDAQNKDQEEYALDRELTLTLVSGYDIPLRHRVVTKLAELESRPAQPMIPQTLSEALRLAADLADQRAQLSEQLAIAAPKAEALARIAEADGCLGLQEAGKALQQKPNKFINWLREKGWIYRRAGSSTNLGRAEKVDAGYVTHKVRTIDLPDGGQKVCEQALITPKGLVKLSMMLNVKQPSDRAMIGGMA